jgi:hypothetical protein
MAPVDEQKSSIINSARISLLKLRRLRSRTVQSNQEVYLQQGNSFCSNMLISAHSSKFAPLKFIGDGPTCLNASLDVDTNSGVNMGHVRAALPTSPMTSKKVSPNPRYLCHKQLQKACHGGRFVVESQGCRSHSYCM